jgi:hypothetical protein
MKILHPWLLIQKSDLIISKSNGIVHCTYYGTEDISDGVVTNER